jgi:L-glutamine-phosphate cytidylyltransferase
MRVLILAAGRGTRISRYLSGRPKCTVDIGGEYLIKYTINQLKNKGIKDIGIIVGYEHDEIRKVLEGENVKYYFNPFFDVTNSIASAWFAREFINNDEDIMIMNGDVFLESDLIDDIISENQSPILFSDETRKEEADYKFLYEDNILKKYGKELKGSDITGEYIGVAKFKQSFITIFLDQLDKMIANQQHSVWWENILYELTKEMNIFVRDVEGKFWAEVDYIEDYERILKFREYKINYNIEVIKTM